MNFKHSSSRSQPEQASSIRLRRYMKAQGWYVKKIHGGKYQSGLPDLYCHHPQHGHRWIETKVPKGKLSDSQIQEFTRLHKACDKIYVLEDETHYYRLFATRDNWMEYVRL